jgi:hypothetical protein
MDEGVSCPVDYQGLSRLRGRERDHLSPWDIQTSVEVNWNGISLKSHAAPISFHPQTRAHGRRGEEVGGGGDGAGRVGGLIQPEVSLNPI